MASTQYKKPPITEAVIEVRLNNSLPREVLEKIRNGVKSRYESSEDISTFEFVIDTAKADFSRKQGSFAGFKLTNSDKTDVLQIMKNTMTCSRLAPYCGWESFEDRARKDWESWRKASRDLRIQRIGVRYLNRIDIPFGNSERIDVNEYITIFPQYPEPDLLKSFTSYAMQIVGPFSTEGFNIIINTNVVRSPLIDHFSVILDLDLSPEPEMSLRGNRIWEVINQMREHKNNAFEMCITDKARELFV